MERNLSDLVSLYQTRAAFALGRIGGIEAQQALEDALGGDARADVLAAVQAALDSM